MYFNFDGALSGARRGRRRGGGWTRSHRQESFKKVIQRFIYLKLYLLSSGAPTRRASGAAEAAVCGIGWTLGPPPLPQQPARRLGAGLAAKGSLVGFGWLVSTGVGRRRGGGALIGLYLSFLWESSFLFLVFSMVFSLAWWRYFLGFCYGESTG